MTCGNAGLGGWYRHSETFWQDGSILPFSYGPDTARANRQGVRYALQEGMTVLDPQTMREVPADGKAMGEIMFRGNIVMKGT